jgi:hypothetical protein
VDYVTQDVDAVSTATSEFEKAYMRPLLIQTLEEKGVDVNLGWDVTQMCEALGIQHGEWFVHHTVSGKSTQPILA